MDGFPAAYEWQIPYDVPSILDKKCVLRIRYNTSSNDFDGWNTFSDGNKIINANPSKDWLGQDIEFVVAAHPLEDIPCFSQHINFGCHVC